MKFYIVYADTFESYIKNQIEAVAEYTTLYYIGAMLLNLVLCSSFPIRCSLFALNAHYRPSGSI